MKNIGYWLGGGVVAFLIARAVVNKQQAVKSLNVNISKIDFNKKDLTFVVFVRLINPGNAPIRINAIVGDIIWKGTYGAVMDYRTPIELKSLEERTIQIPIKMNADLYTLILDLIMGKTKGMLTGLFEIKGNVNAEGLVVPFVYSKEIKVA
jgi:LEA14-like dessication related protein